MELQISMDRIPAPVLPLNIVDYNEPAVLKEPFSLFTNVSSNQPSAGVRGPGTAGSGLASLALSPVNMILSGSHVLYQSCVNAAHRGPIKLTQQPVNHNCRLKRITEPREGGNIPRKI